MPRPHTPLCVMLPEIGVASETFLRSDIEQLVPGGTAVIADPPPAGLSILGTTTWGLAGQPALVFNPIAGDPEPSHQRQRDVARFLDNHAIDVVMIEYLDFADRWFDLLRTLGPRVWLRGHGVDIFARLRDPEWAARYRRFATADGIIVPSYAASQRLEAIGIDKAKLHIQAHAVDIPTNAHKHRSPAACVCAGRLVAKKAPLLTLEAFRQAHRQRPDLTLDMIGDGPLATAVHQFVHDHQLHHAVRLHGQLDHAQTLHIIRNSDLLLHHAVTSPDDGDSEGQPLAILEGMAGGLAIVTTRHAGIPELITHNRTGLLVDEGDTSATCQRIVELADSPDERERLGLAARRTVAASHTFSKVRQDLVQLMGLPDQVRGER